MSIIIVLSGSMTIVRPTLKLPLCSHVQAVAVQASSLPFDRRPKNATTAPANATKTLAAESQAALRREIRVPASAIAAAPTSGATRQIHAPAIIRAAPTDRRRRARAGGG